jgi:hypothetical protein
MAVAVLFARRIMGPRIDTTATLTVEKAETDWEFPSWGGFVRGGNGLVVHEIPGDTLKTVAFLGDSHAEQYWPRVVQKAAMSERTTGRVRFITYGGCPLLPYVNRTRIAYHGGHFRCPDFYRRAMWLAEQPSVKVVVLATWWEANIDGNYYAGRGRLTNGLVSSFSGSPDPLDLLEKDVAALTSKGKRVFIVLSYPSGPAFLPASILPSRVPFLSIPHVTSVPRKDYERAAGGTVARLRQLAATTGAIVIDPLSSLCTASTCPTVGPDGLPMYKDSNHFRASYAKRFLSYIDVVLE